LIRQKYVCTNPKCAAVDTPQFFEGEQIFMQLNCWNCHAGCGKSPQEIAAHRLGMWRDGDPYPVDSGHRFVEKAA
jgi:CxxC motif-containing protein (DUF1111 family)